MNKWDYIRRISERGDRYGFRGGVCSLLEWAGKQNTDEITLDEAKRFYELGAKQ